MACFLHTDVSMLLCDFEDDTDLCPDNMWSHDGGMRRKRLPHYEADHSGSNGRYNIIIP